MNVISQSSSGQMYFCLTR